MSQVAKHRLSPAPLPPSKRQCGVQLSSEQRIITTFDNALYDELVLFIFSFLDSRDLCAIQATSRNCSRLANDDQLWKALFVREFGKARLRGGKGFYGRADGRLVKPLPSRIPAPAGESLNWKWMYRISSNWRNGRCAVQKLDDAEVVLGPQSRVPALHERTSPPGSHVLLAGSLTISASSAASQQPTILLRNRNDLLLSMTCRSHITSEPIEISTIAIDQSSPASNRLSQAFLRFAAFLSTGEFVVYEHDPSLSSSSTTSPRLAFIPSSRHRSVVTHAAYHHPLLVTLSHSFTLMVYDLSGDTITHTQSLSSFTSHPPTSLILSAVPSSSSYRLVLAYAIPVYPAHWSVGTTELIISPSGSTTLTPDNHLNVATPRGKFVVRSTRSARAFDVPQGWIDETKLQAMRAQWGRKVKQVADTQTDGKWVVLAPGDAPDSSSSSSSRGSLSDERSSNTLPASSSTSYVSPSSHSSAHLQLYRLHMPPPTSSHAPKLTFVRTLHGPLGHVSALSLADGRCVSLGVNGSIWVWDLEGGDGAEVAGPVELCERGSGRGTVAFDERRIVSSGIRGIEERRFDI
ncbi:hypothetical protein F5I97DRAFT_1816334 [Phlebopus sp. FC_14]|nr:hypothetical protein F5I97DRAFT_1816334 [Phlebopus sp. FC_14]